MSSQLDLLPAPKRAKKEKPAKVPYIDAPPLGAIVLMRPDTKREKAMGWALCTIGCVGTRSVLVHLEFKVKRPNEAFRGMTQAAMMGIRAGNARAREWTKAALAQCDLPVPLRPLRVTLTRLSTGKMDDDGLVGCFKFVRDGVAAALGFNDREFSIGGQREGATPIFYEQVSPGKRGAFGVRIEVRW